MILKFKVYEQTISLQATKSEPRQGSKDYLELQFSFSSDWNDLLKYVYLQHGEVSVPHDLTGGSIIVDEYFTEQTEFNVTLFGKSADGSIEVPTNVITVFLKESNNLWVKDAPAPQNSWVVQVIDARDEALAAAIRAENAAIHQPYPNAETGTWWVWDADSGAYKDTGVSVDSSITVDSELSDTSENPVQNKVIKSALDKLGVQSDWNQNDDIQPDYVKNRPFYTGAPVETVLVEESTVSFAPENGVYMGQLNLTFLPTIGETYKVSWDGVVYECTSVSVGGVPAIGNLAIIGGGSDTGEPFVMGIQNGERIIIYTTDTSASHTFSISGLVGETVKIDAKYLPFPFKPDGISYLTFSSRNSFSLIIREKSWDGTLEYFASDETWTIWDGTSLLSAAANGGEYVLYLRGTGNTAITRGSGFVLLGSNISCIGNIETLLDYATVESGGHPVMAESCYRGMFSNCTSLTRAPELPATTLASECYNFMFSGCTNLIQAPELPATTLASSCYQGMFQDCTSLTQAPELPATTLASSCYYMMFQGCTSLARAPELPATILASECYYMMFSGCTSLTQAPTLSATTLASECYYRMFEDCTSLTQVPELPATTLANLCYCGMFYGCTSLKLSETKTEEYTQEYRIPLSGDGTDASAALAEMFISTGGTFTGTPKISTTYYLSSDNMIARGSGIANLNGYVKSMIDNAGECIPVPATAEVGQTVVVKAVDANGKPTEWEAADMTSGVQPDWNQNDATQPDYVKNRPLYTGGPVETTFVEDSTVSFTRNEHSGFYLGSLQSTFVATVGETYKVSWDGTTYESTCVSSNGHTVIGNLSMRGAGPDTGEPFIMMVYNRVGIEIATADTSASHTFSIGGFIPEVVKIDRKYLPKAAFITYDSSSSTYNSDLTNDELYEIMLNGEQVVLYDQSEKTHYYLKKWRIHPSGRIDLCFVREEFEITLFPDGTIGKTPNE